MVEMVEPVVLFLVGYVIPVEGRGGEGEKEKAHKKKKDR
jgi:hypothetical protein